MLLASDPVQWKWLWQKQRDDIDIEDAPAAFKSDEWKYFCVLVPRDEKDERDDKVMDT